MSVRYGQSSYRCRTDEFSGIVERLRVSIAPAENSSNRNDDARREYPRSAIKSEFNGRASKIGLAINQTSQRVSKLAKLAKRTSVFDDPTQEIQELQVVIIQEVSALTTALSDLQVFCNSKNDEGNISSDATKHKKIVVEILNSRLKDTTKEFKDASLPWANGSSSSSSQLILRKQGEAESLPFLQQSQQQQQQMVPLQDTYMQSRKEALHNVESTIQDVSNIFTELATMVSQQGEIAIRIDQNMEDTLANVEGAQSQLAMYLTSISSNRWLIMKIFFVLIPFLMIFLFFVA